jgi:hypothetical protein
VSWRVIVRPKAEADLREAAHWYESRRPHLGSQFLDEISEALHLLEITPERQPFYFCLCANKSLQKNRKSRPP